MKKAQEVVDLLNQNSSSTFQLEAYKPGRYTLYALCKVVDTKTGAYQNISGFMNLCDFLAYAEKLGIYNLKG